MSEWIEDSSRPSGWFWANDAGQRSAIDLNDYAHTAEQRGWGPGWPSCSGANGKTVAVIAARSGVRITVHTKIARLVQMLIDTTEARGYLLHSGWCWGYNCRPIAGTNVPSNHSWGLACFAGDTEVLTRDGAATLREIAGTDTELLTRDPFEGKSGRWVTAPVRSFGVQPTMRLTIGRRAEQRTVEVTPDHRWYVYRQRQEPRSDRPGKTKPIWRVFETTTAQLQPGDRLVMCMPIALTRREAPSSIGVAHGVVYGDGALSRTAGAIVDLFGSKNAELLRFFPEPTVHALADTPGGETILRVSLLPRYFKKLPSLDESSQYLMGFLAGWFAADGTVGKNGSPSLSSSDLDALRWAERACLRLGIGTTPIATKKRMSPYGVRPSHVLTLMRQTVGEAFFVRTDHRQRFVDAPTADDKTAWTVRAIEDGPEQEVFCATVPETRAFVLAGYVLTGNCDINAPANPYTHPRVTDMPPWMPLLWNRYGFAWGGNYDGKQDSMHYEFMGTPADADAMTALALAELATPVAAAPPEEDPMTVFTWPSGAGAYKLVCPVGSASQITAAAWLSLACDGVISHFDVWFQGDKGGLGEEHGALAKDQRGVWQLPDGCTQATVHYVSTGPVGACLEVKPK